MLVNIFFNAKNDYYLPSKCKGQQMSDMSIRFHSDLLNLKYVVVDPHLSLCFSGCVLPHASVHMIACVSTVYTNLP